MANKSSFQNILTSVLSVGNSEQNSTYPPWVFQQHYNVVTSFLLDAAAKLYPNYLDVFLPFVISEVYPIKDGFVELKENYRNLLGAPSINAAPDGKECEPTIPINTASEFRVANLKGGCQTYPLEILSKGEFDERTKSSYAYPTFKNPIGMFIGRKIKVCPYDMSRVLVVSLKKEVEGVMAYIMQPDDTYLVDDANSVEVGWDNAASSYLFRGCLALYSAYVKDNNLVEFVRILQAEKLL